MATAQPRTAISGEPTAAAGAQPVYAEPSVYQSKTTTAQPGTVEVRASSVYGGTGTIAARSRYATVNNLYTGQTAIPALAPPGAFGRSGPEAAAIREQLGPEGVQAVLDYRRATGEFPDLSVVFGGGSSGGGSEPGGGGPVLAGLGGLGGGIGIWILASITGLALLFIFGPGTKGRRR